jgi:hypothetical protein
VPEMIERSLFDRGQQLPPGEHLMSDPIDVKGVQRLTVNVRFAHVVDNVRRNIAFGHGAAPAGWGFVLNSPGRRHPAGS